MVLSIDMFQVQKTFLYFQIVFRHFFVLIMNINILFCLIT